MNESKKLDFLSNFNGPLQPQAPQGEFLMFASADGRVRIECRFAGDTLWLSQAMMAELYQVTPQAITQHIRAVYEEGELDQNATCKDYLQVQQEGKRQVNGHSSSIIGSISLP